MILKEICLMNSKKNLHRPNILRDWPNILHSWKMIHNRCSRHIQLVVKVLLWPHHHFAHWNGFLVVGMMLATEHKGVVQWYDHKSKTPESHMEIDKISKCVCLDSWKPRKKGISQSRMKLIRNQSVFAWTPENQEKKTGIATTMPGYLVTYLLEWN